MDFLTTAHTMDITLWELTGKDGFGNPTFSLPQHLKGRWEDRIELIQNEEGQMIPSRAKVFLSRDVKMGDYLHNGISNDANPLTTSGAYRVQRFMSVPSFDGQAFERRAQL